MIGGVASGHLSRRIELRRLVETVDPISGQPVKSYVHKAYAWAQVLPFRGKEKMQSGRDDLAVMMYTFKIRFRAVSVTDIILFDGATWDIKSMAPMGRRNREFIELVGEQVDVKDLF
jgi:SPP1 family predicted phage head-tail adaptor